MKIDYEKGEVVQMKLPEAMNVFSYQDSFRKTIGDFESLPFHTREEYNRYMELGHHSWKLFETGYMNVDSYPVSKGDQVEVLSLLRGNQLIVSKIDGLFLDGNKASIVSVDDMVKGVAQVDY